MSFSLAVVAVETHIVAEAVEAVTPKLLKPFCQWLEPSIPLSLAPGEEV